MSPLFNTTVLTEPSPSKLSTAVPVRMLIPCSTKELSIFTEISDSKATFRQCGANSTSVISLPPILLISSANSTPIKPPPTITIEFAFSTSVFKATTLSKSFSMT